MGVGLGNTGYLQTKRTRMGHAIDDQQLTDASAERGGTAAEAEALLEGHAS